MTSTPPYKKFSRSKCKWKFSEENSTKRIQFERSGLTKKLLQNNQPALTTVGNGGVRPPEKSCWCQHTGDFPEKGKTVSNQNCKKIRFNIILFLKINVCSGSGLSLPLPLPFCVALRAAASSCRSVCSFVPRHFVPQRLPFVPRHLLFVPRRSPFVLWRWCFVLRRLLFVPHGFSLCCSVCSIVVRRHCCVSSRNVACRVATLRVKSQRCVHRASCRGIVRRATALHIIPECCASFRSVVRHSGASRNTPECCASFRGVAHRNRACASRGEVRVRKRGSVSKEGGCASKKGGCASKRGLRIKKGAATRLDFYFLFLRQGNRRHRFLKNNQTGITRKLWWLVSGCWWRFPEAGGIRRLVAAEMPPLLWLG